MNNLPIYTYVHKTIDNYTPSKLKLYFICNWCTNMIFNIKHNFYKVAFYENAFKLLLDYQVYVSMFV